MVASLKQVITANFVSGLSGPGSKETAKAPQREKDDSATVDISLRNGARNFAMGLQAINAGITYVQVSKQTNEQLLGVVDRLDLLLSRAAKGTLGSSSAKEVIKEFQDLAKKFQGIIKGARVNKSEILDPDTLSAQLARSGLDPEKVDALSKAFSKLTSLTGTSVDSQGEVTSASTLIPVSSFSAAVRKAVAEFESGIDGDPTATDADAYIGTFRRIREQLKGVRVKLERNIEALDETLTVLRKNIELTRATGMAMLDLSEEIRGDESPEEIAERLRQQITASVPAALSQSNNLSAIMVAGLTMSEDTEKAKKNS